MQNRNNGFQVLPRSTNELIELTHKVRKIAKAKGFVDSNNYLYIVQLIEFGGLFKNNERGSCLEVVEDQELPNAFAQTFPDGTIKVRESIYDKACEGNGHARFTLAHELGHLIMHRSQMSMARVTNDNTKTYCNSEWQADEFAGQLLVPTTDIRHYSNDLYSSVYIADKIAERYGVSTSCAEIRLRKCK